MSSFRENHFFLRSLALFLSLGLALPSPALALRVQSGGLEERNRTTVDLESRLRSRPSSPAQPTLSGLEEFSEEALETVVASLARGEGEAFAVERMKQWIYAPLQAALVGTGEVRELNNHRILIEGSPHLPLDEARLRAYLSSKWLSRYGTESQKMEVEVNSMVAWIETFGWGPSADVVQFLSHFNKGVSLKLQTLESILKTYRRAESIFDALYVRGISPRRSSVLDSFLQKEWRQARDAYAEELIELVQAYSVAEGLVEIFDQTGTVDEEMLDSLEQRMEDRGRLHAGEELGRLRTLISETRVLAERFSKEVMGESEEIPISLIQERAGIAFNKLTTGMEESGKPEQPGEPDVDENGVPVSKTKTGTSVEYDADKPVVVIEPKPKPESSSGLEEVEVQRVAGVAEQDGVLVGDRVIPWAGRSMNWYSGLEETGELVPIGLQQILHEREDRLVVPLAKIPSETAVYIQSGVWVDPAPMVQALKEAGVHGVELFDLSNVPQGEPGQEKVYLVDLPIGSERREWILDKSALVINFRGAPLESRPETLGELGGLINVAREVNRAAQAADEKVLQMGRFQFHRSTDPETRNRLFALEGQV